jgi:hypothetical protein
MSQCGSRPKIELEKSNSVGLVIKQCVLHGKSSSDLWWKLGPNADDELLAMQGTEDYSQ